MRPRTIRHLSRTPVLRLRLEFLEDRRLLSGLPALIDAYLSRPSDDGPAMFGPLQGNAPDDKAGAPVQPAAPGPLATLTAVTQKGEDAATQALPAAAKALRADDAHEGSGPDSTHSPHQQHASDEGEHAQDDSPSEKHHSSSPPAHDEGSGTSRHERASEDEDAGRSSRVSDSGSRTRADRSLDDNNPATETGHSADLTTAVPVPAVMSTGTGRIGLAAVAHKALVGPSGLHTSAAVLDKAIVDSPQENPPHGQQAARAEQAASPMAEPARDGAPPELTANSLTAQANSTSVARPEGGADQKAGLFNMPFLAFAEGRGEFELWGLSMTAADLGAEGDPETRGYSARFGAGARGAHQALSVVEVGSVMPEGSELAAGVLSADTSALEEAVRQFLNGLHTVGRELTRVFSENGWARWAVVATLTALAAETGRRRLQERSRRGASPEEEEGVTLSWLSGSYPFRPDEG